MQATIKKDKNENKIVSIKPFATTKRGFSIQTNGNLPLCHEKEIGFTFYSHHDIELWKEIKRHVQLYGTDRQKSIFGISSSGLIKDYIYSSISNEGYENEPYYTDDLVLFLFECFQSEYGHMIQRIGVYNAFKEYIPCLPSCFNIAFTNCGIVRLGKEFGYLKHNATERQEDKFIDNWFNLIASHTFKMFRVHYKVKNRI